MRTHARMVGGVIALAVLGLWLVAGGERGSAAGGKDPSGVPIPEADFKKLVAKSTADCLKALGEKDKSAKAKARTAAVMIAAYAQYGEGGASPEMRATLRDAALKLADTIEKGNTAEAVKQAEALASLKPNAGAKLGPMAILKEAKIPLNLYMRQFNTVGAGGYGIENHYKLLSGKTKELPAKEMTDNLILSAYQIAVVAELIQAYEIAENPKEWNKFAEELRKNSLDVAAACKNKDGSLGFSSVYRVLRNCNDCHKKNRE